MNESVTPAYPCILHGADYNPEQWPRPVWDEDVRLMREAGCNIVSLPIFAWSALQPAEDTFTFDWLDEVLDKLEAAGIYLSLATPTASLPPWMSHRYPTMMRVDEHGVRHRTGNRQHVCPNSADYRRFTADIAGRMAQRYGGRSNLLWWHVSNEYAYHCYCDRCAEAFRQWLRERYGSLEALNGRWSARFWGQYYTDWEQIDPPVSYGQTCLQAMRIDYDRFQSHSILQCFLNEKAQLRRCTPNVPVTTNFMGAFKPLDYHAWAKHLDFISWDSYPRRGATPAQIAFPHALMRGLKEGQPWVLMEQTPSQQNWAPYNALKRPGVLRLWSYQAVAHGSEAVMYFQWRRGRGGQEKFHGAIVEHEGSTRPRVFQEVRALGAELRALGDRTLGGRVEAPAALLFDWENWWAIEYSSGPSIELKYRPHVERYYAALFNSGVTCDVLSPEANLDRYRVVLAPMLYMVRPGVAERLAHYVSAGGTLVIGFFCGIVDENDRVHLGGYPGPLRELAGVWIEEVDALSPEESNTVIFDPGLGDCRGEQPCGVLCELMHSEGADVLARFGRDFYRGMPAVTRNRFGQGTIYYIGAVLEEPVLRPLLKAICEEAGAAGPLPEHVPGVEAVVRIHENGTRLLYLLNHNASTVAIALPPGEHRDLLAGDACRNRLKLDPYAVRILAVE